MSQTYFEWMDANGMAVSYVKLSTSA